MLFSTGGQTCCDGLLPSSFALYVSVESSVVLVGEVVNSARPNLSFSSAPHICRLLAVGVCDVRDVMFGVLFVSLCCLPVSCVRGTL